MHFWSHTFPFHISLESFSPIHLQAALLRSIFYVTLSSSKRKAMWNIKCIGHQEYKAFKISASFINYKGEKTQMKFDFYGGERNILSFE